MFRDAILAAKTPKEKLEIYRSYCRERGGCDTATAVVDDSEADAAISGDSAVLYTYRKGRLEWIEGAISKDAATELLGQDDLSERLRAKLERIVSETRGDP